MENLRAALPRLVAAYDRGLLVPFIGAGISTPNCALWGEFIANLEHAAGIHSEAEGFATRSTDQLIQRAARAVRMLKYRSQQKFEAAVSGAIRSEGYTEHNPGPCPINSEALAKIWWPLVVTTNYDDWFFTQWNNSGRRADLPSWDKMQVCGRGDVDCERVVNSLRAPENPLFWAVQGFLGGCHPQYGKPTEPFEIAHRAELASQLVVGHEEYRRVGHKSPGFRRAFSEVFRSRSFLFIGSGLEEGYFRNLFDEVLELQGSLPFGHFAFIKKGSVNTRFLRERYQIEVLEYEEHDEIPLWIEEFRKTIYSKRARAALWGVDVRSEGWVQNNEVGLRVSRQGLPTPKDGECLFISAGLSEDGRPLIHPHRLDFLQSTFPDLDLTCTKIQGAMVWRFIAQPVFVVCARDEHLHGRDARDARVVADVMESALRCAEEAGFHTMHSMLLSAGGGRVFPAHVSLVQMARGYKKSRISGRLNICLTDPWCVHLLTSGRLVLSEVIAIDDIRFWLLIIRPDGDVLRYWECASPDTLLKAVMEKYDLDGMHWEGSIQPSPVSPQHTITSAQIATDATWTVATAGLMPGSTFQIRVK